ncbi:MAG: dolichyl-phosphate-mannose--protein mannosyltransferase [Aeromicrobium sp.]
MGSSSQVAYDRVVTVSEKTRGWAGPIAVALLALVLRVWNLGYPKVFLFDETYYAKDAYSLRKFGYVQDYVEKANNRIVDGKFTGLFTGEPTQIVHPDAGKWLISIGEWLFGMDSFGWRISAAVVGALTVLILARLVRRLTGSTVMGCIAGLLLCFDGTHFVMSRLALLDIFLVFWLVSAVACLVADLDWITARLDRLRLFRPWQLAAGVCFGLACGTKWSAVYALAAFSLTVVALEVLARRRAWKESGGHRHGKIPGRISTAVIVGFPAFITIVGVAFLVYLSTWTGWLIHHDLFEQRFGRGYGDNPAWGSYFETPAKGFFGESLQALRSLWHFHQMTYDFHTGKYLAGKTHPYQSSPVGWLVLERPVGVDAQNDLPAASCGAPAGSTCMRQILILGNPIIWWSGALALVAAVAAWITTRDWRWSVPLIGVAATWLPWFLYDDRPVFSFYAVAIIPFTIIAIVLVIDGLWKFAGTPRTRYLVGLLAGIYLVAVVVTFWYFHPIYTDALISYDDWHRRMWFRRWI